MNVCLSLCALRLAGDQSMVYSYTRKASWDRLWNLAILNRVRKYPRNPYKFISKTDNFSAINNDLAFLLLSPHLRKAWPTCLFRTKCVFLVPRCDAPPHNRTPCTRSKKIGGITTLCMSNSFPDCGDSLCLSGFVVTPSRCGLYDENTTVLAHYARCQHYVCVRCCLLEVRLEGANGH